MKFARLVLLFLAATLVLSGCASTQRLSDTDRARVKAVAIDTKVDKGEMFLMAPNSANIGLMFGAVGGLMASGAINDQKTVFKSFVDAHGVSVEAIVRDEFEKALRESGKLAVVVTKGPDVPLISLSVPQYGFGLTHMLSSNVVPVMRIAGKMTDRDGKVLWAESETILPSIASPMETTTWVKLHDDPKTIEQEWRKAAHYLAQKIVATL